MLGGQEGETEGEPTAEKSSFLFHGFEARVVDDFDCRRAKGKLAARKSADPPPSPPAAVTITVVSTENVLQCNAMQCSPAACCSSRLHLFSDETDWRKEFQ